MPLEEQVASIKQSSELQVFNDNILLVFVINGGLEQSVMCH